MASEKQLPNPPIKEAMLTVQTSPVADPQTNLESMIPDDIQESFPRKRQTIQARFRSLEDTAEPSLAERSVIAELRDSPDMSRTFAARHNGMSLSALAGSYPGWPQFKEEFFVLWNRYADLNQPEIVERVSTRFVNSIKLPWKSDLMVDTDDWLVNGPRVPEGLPDRLSRFTNQVGVLMDDRTRVLINLVSGGDAPDGSGLVVILDIDVTREVSFPRSNGYAGIDESIEGLRAIKNSAFFGSLTEQAMELFQ